MDTNILYYNYSTIPQVLVALVAFSGVFVIYRIRQFADELCMIADLSIKELDQQKEIIEKDKIRKALTSAVHFGRIAEMKDHLLSLQQMDINFFKSVNKKPALNPEIFKKTYATFCETLRKRNKFLYQFGWIIWPGMILMIGSLIQLANIDWVVNCWNCAGKILFILTWLLTAIYLAWAMIFLGISIRTHSI